MANTPTPEVELTEQDIQFECPCGKNYIVIDEAGSGLELPCPFCQDPIMIPFRKDLEAAKAAKAEATAQTQLPLTELATTAQLAAAEPSPEPEKEPEPLPTFDFSSKSSEELTETMVSVKGRMKENASQRTEVQGHLNRSTIETHRRTLQMQKLVDRQSKIEAEYKALKAAGAE